MYIVILKYILFFYYKATFYNKYYTKCLLLLNHSHSFYNTTSLLMKSDNILSSIDLDCHAVIGPGRYTPRLYDFRFFELHVRIIWVTSIVVSQRQTVLISVYSCYYFLLNITLQSSSVTKNLFSSSILIFVLNGFCSFPERCITWKISFDYNEDIYHTSLYTCKLIIL